MLQHQSMMTILRALIMTHTRVRSLMLSAGIIMVTACSDTIPSAPAPAKDQLVYALRFDARAVTMAVGDTFTLSVHPINVLGAQIQIPDSVPVQYAIEDQPYMHLTSSGEVVADQPTP